MNERLGLVPNRLKPWLIGIGTWAVVAYPLSTTLPIVAGRFIASAWAACDDAEPPYLFALFIESIILSGLGLALFAIAFVLLRRRSFLLRVAAGVLAITIPIAVWVVASVPAHDADFYHDFTDPEVVALFGVECDADGIPTWWPDWLPH